MNTTPISVAGELCRIFSLSPVAVDIGAAGELHQPFQKLLDAQSQIIMIEPGSDRFAELSMKYGCYHNVSIHNIGLWDRNGTFPLHFSDTRGASLYRPDLELCSKYVDEHLDLNPTGLIVDVVVRKASEFFSETNGVGALTLMKVDTQGCELDIMRDLSPLLGSTMSVYTEAPLSASYDGQPSLSEYIDFFISHGFELFDITLNKALRTSLPNRSEFLRKQFKIHGQPRWLKHRLMDGDLLFFKALKVDEEISKVANLAIAYCVYGYYLEAFCLLKDARNMRQYSEDEHDTITQSINLMVRHITTTRPIVSRTKVLSFVERTVKRMFRRISGYYQTWAANIK